MRGLTRAREDLKGIELQARPRLGAFLLRHSRGYGGKSHWTQAHWRWLELQRFEHPVQQIVLQEYIDTVKEAQRRVANLKKEMQAAWSGWSMAPVIQALMALRGVSLITAMTTLAELGDLTRFDSPKALMGFLGWVPGEHSSGTRRRQRGITLTGNGHVRRVRVEAAWSDRFPARKSRCIERRAEKASGRVQALAWACPKRLCSRHRRLMATGKAKQQVTTAIARERAGFIWAIACEVQGQAHGSKALA